MQFVVVVINRNRTSCNESIDKQYWRQFSFTKRMDSSSDHYWLEQKDGRN